MKEATGAYVTLRRFIGGVFCRRGVGFRYAVSHVGLNFTEVGMWWMERFTLWEVSGSFCLVAVRLLPLVGILLLRLLPAERFVKEVAFGVSCATFIVSQFLWVNFLENANTFQFVTSFTWNGPGSSSSGGDVYPVHAVHAIFGVDGISRLFILLTTFLIPICLLASWDSISKDIKGYCRCFLLLESGLCLVFSVLDVLLFYVCFETLLLPRFVLIGIWGSRTRKIRAAYQFFLYTLLGSLFRLVAIVRRAFEAGTTDFAALCFLRDGGEVVWSAERERLLFLAFFASFAVKVPRVPFHLWLPEAHVEAPTAGSVLLAGILLKLGTYGFLRFSLGLFAEASAYYAPLRFRRSVVAIVYTSRTTLRQIDLKKIVAYSSVAHRGYVTMGIFTRTIEGIEGALLIRLSHGFVSSALFLCIGVLYDRHHTRILKYYSGRVQTRPVFAVVFVFFTRANLGFPGTSAFPGEFLSLVGAVQSSITVTVLSSTGRVLGAAYSIWLCNRLLFGGSSHNKLRALLLTKDLTGRERASFAPLRFCTLWFGVYPEIALNVRHTSVVQLLA